MSGRCNCGAATASGCQCGIADSDCIRADGSGSAANPFRLSPVINPNPDNILTCGPDGMLAEIPDSFKCPPITRVTRQTDFSLPSLVDTEFPFDHAWYDTSPTSFVAPRLVAPVAGVYLVLATVAFEPATGGDGTFRSIRIRRNSLDIVGGQSLMPNGATTVVEATAFVALSAGGTVDLMVAHDGASAVNMPYEPELVCFMTWQLLRMGSCP